MEWKKTDLLGVESMMAAEGKYTGLSQKVTNFTPQFLKNCFNRFTSIKPLFLAHNGDRIPMGYITSLGFDESDSKLHFKGIVFDDAKKQRVIDEGFDCISPEFELLSGTPENPIDGQIVCGAFTRYPAIPGTEINKCVLAFSAIDDATQAIVNEGTNNMLDVNTTPTNTTTSTSSVPNGTYTSSAPAYSAAEVELAKKQIDEQIGSFKNTITTLTTERDSFKNRVEAAEQAATDFKGKYEKILAGEVAKVEVELKALGIDTPGEVAKGLDVETRLEVLKSAKANLAKNSNLTAPPEGNLEARPPAKDRKEAARKMGLDEKYMQFIK